MSSFMPNSSCSHWKNPRLASVWAAGRSLVGVVDPGEVVGEGRRVLIGAPGKTMVWMAEAWVDYGVLVLTWAFGPQISGISQIIFPCLWLHSPGANGLIEDLFGQGACLRVRF
jgi:hypothetical protein